MDMGLLAVALCLLAVSLVSAEEPNQKLQIARSARVVDLSSQLVNQTAVERGGICCWTLLLFYRGFAGATIRPISVTVFYFVS